MFIFICVRIHAMFEHVFEGQKKMLYLLELELQALGYELQVWPSKGEL